jgi:hypothetical protein
MASPLDPWQPFILDREAFHFLVSTTLLSQDTKALAQHNLNLPGHGQLAHHIHHRKRSDLYDNLAGISYSQEHDRFRARSVSIPLAKRLEITPIPGFLEWAFTHGFPDWAVEARAYLSQIPDPPFYPNEKKPG